MKTFLSAGVSAAAMTVVLGGLFAATPAAAQDASSIRAIQRQIQQLQADLRRLQAQAADRDIALKQAQDEAANARAAAADAQRRSAANVLAVPPTAAPNSAIVTIPPNDKDAAGQPVYNPNKPNGRFNLGGVTVTLGGFIDLDGIYRSRNETRGTATSFTGVPFAQSADGHLGEFRMTAQQTRLSILVQGNIDKDDAVSGFVEGDFNNAAGGTNSVQSSSYTPRLRQAYAELDNAPYGVHLLGGQIWSLATPFKSGLNPRTEIQPLTIDTSYLPGYTYLRVPELRLSKDFGGKYWIALAADDPQTVFGGTAVLPGGTTLVTGSGSGTVNPGAGGLNPATNYSYSVAPDMILKAAADTAFGHYELFGMARWFKDRVEFAGAPHSDTSSVTMGAGVGASAYVPLVKNYLEFSGNVLYGSGIGRYGSGGLPDVTYKANGSLTALREIMGTAGLIGHPIPAVDIYAYYGIDQVQKKAFTVAAGSGGYGFEGDNTGCGTELSALKCTSNNHQVSEFTTGFWWRFYKGSYGTVQTGAQYGLIEREIFDGKGGAKTAPENVVFAALRYTPFQ